jgi:hypothetical protein
MAQDKPANLKGKAPEETPPVATEAPVEATPAEVTAPKTKKTPIEDGFVAPVEFAKFLSKQVGEEVPPQMVYGYLKNMKNFPQKDRGDGVVPRIVIPLQEALDFMKTKAVEKAEKAAAKVATAQAPTETPTPA